ncbi:hypothetical protein BVY01_02450 [bacterium I07]|nr:hypothetical protein BVY01_02450 [bacterium I07]
MNRIEELAPLDLVPSRKFHSCVMTGYNIDYHYFNHIIRPKLTRLGIVNIMVLIDDVKLSQSLGTFTGNTNLRTAPFSIHGIHAKGTFHPKVNLFLGEKEGFLIIGSGNPSSGGFGDNMELWGALHFQDERDPKLTLLADAWQYIKKFSVQLQGFSKRKFDWIGEYSSLIQHLESEEKPDEIPKNNKWDVRFLDTQAEPLSVSLQKYLESEKIENIYLLSPFFDQKAQVLSDLLEFFSKANVHVFIQPGRTYFPKTFKTSQKNRLQFYNWDHLTSQNRYLHAKLLIFQGKHVEYCLFGSANITRAAFGTTSFSPVNEEACLLMRRSKGSWLANLGLGQLPDEEPFSKIVESLPDPDQDEIDKHSAFDIKILSAEIDHFRLYIYCTELVNIEHLTLLLYDEFGDTIDSIDLSAGQCISEEGGTFSIIIEDDAIREEICYIQLVNTKTSKYSNKQIVHDIEMLIKSNPDPELIGLLIRMGEIEAGTKNIFDIYQYLNPEDILSTDHDSEMGTRRSVITQEQEEKEPEEENEDEKRISYEEFIRKRDDKLSHRMRHLHRSYTLQSIFDILNIVLRRQQEVHENTAMEDESDEIDQSTGRDDTKREVRIFKVSEYESLCRRITSFHKKYLKTMEERIEKNENLRLVDVTMFAIVLHLLINLANLKINLRKKEDQVETVEEKILLPVNCTDKRYDNFTDLVVQIVGKFLFLLSNDQGNREKYEQKQITNLLNTAYYHIVFCLSVIYVISNQEDEDVRSQIHDWVWILYMNTRRQFHKQTEDYEVLGRELETRLKASGLNEIFSLNKIFRTGKNCDEWFILFGNPTECKRLRRLKDRRRAFSKFFDLYCTAHYIETKKEGDVVNVSHPGYPFLDKRHEYLNTKVLVLPYAKFFACK